MLRGVAAFREHVWAVGYYGDGKATHPLIVRRTPDGWVASKGADAGKVMNSLNGVAGTGPNELWTVGYYSDDGLNDHPLVEHWDGASWTVAPNPAMNGRLNAITVLFAADAWAVGESDGKALILHWDESKWSSGFATTAGGLRSGLNAVAASTPKDIWALGWMSESKTDHTLALHWDGVEWQYVDSW